MFVLLTQVILLSRSAGISEEKYSRRKAVFQTIFQFLGKWVCWCFLFLNSKGTCVHVLKSNFNAVEFENGLEWHFICLIFLDRKDKQLPDQKLRIGNSSFCFFRFVGTFEDDLVSQFCFQIVCDKVVLIWQARQKAATECLLKGWHSIFGYFWPMHRASHTLLYQNLFLCGILPWLQFIPHANTKSHTLTKSAPIQLLLAPESSSGVDAGFGWWGGEVQPNRGLTPASKS